jgi:hypothetical protein
MDTIKFNVYVNSYMLGHSYGAQSSLNDINAYKV